METTDKEYNMEEIVKLVNEQEGEFILSIELEADDGD